MFLKQISTPSYKAETKSVSLAGVAVQIRISTLPGFEDGRVIVLGLSNKHV